jgi:hypothetical protein
MAVPTINGTPIKVSTMRFTPTRAGRGTQAKSGKRHWFQQVSRLYTGVWELTCEGLTFAEAQTIYNATFGVTTNVPLTFAPGDGRSFTVQCEDDSYEEETGDIQTDGSPRWNVTVKLYQAN